jgi:hypothetical protein
MTLIFSLANMATRYVFFAGTKSRQMKMAYAQLVVMYMQTTRQNLNHSLRRK